MKRVRVLFLLDDIWSMDEGKGVPSLALLLDLCAPRFDCRVLTTDERGYRPPPGMSLRRVARLRAPACGGRWIAYLWAWLNYAWITLRYLIAGLRGPVPDVIYCSSAYPALAAFLLARACRRPEIRRLYGTFLHPVLGSPLQLCVRGIESLSYLLPADKFVLTDDGTRADRVAARFGIPRSAVWFLRNGVDMCEDDPDETRRLRHSVRAGLGIPADAPIVLAVSRLAAWKRVDLIVAAVNRLPAGERYLVVVGDGPERRSLEASARDPGIRFVGAVDRARVREFMRAADCFVSMYELSNLGNPLFEALSAGLPVITRDDGGVTSEFLDPGTAILLRGDDESLIGGLSAALREVLASAELRRRLGSAGRSLARRKLTSWRSRLEAEVLLIERFGARKGGGR